MSQLISIYPMSKFHMLESEAGLERWEVTEGEIHFKDLMQALMLYNHNYVNLEVNFIYSSN